MKKQSDGPPTKLLLEMAAFAKVVETKSFTKAALISGVSKAAISKQIARLEANLGAKLIYRTTRRLSLTEAGQALYTHCARINEEAEAAHQAVNHLFSEPRGVLRVSASVAFGIQHVMPAISEFLHLYPQLSVHLGLSDQFVDIAQEGFDVVIRLTNKLGANVVARKLAEFDYVLCASPTYLAKYGTPKTPQELTEHNCLFYSYMDPHAEWELEGPAGRVSVQVTGKFFVNSSEAVRIAAQQGLGIALEPTYSVGEDIHKGALRIVLPEYNPHGRFGNSVFAVYMPTRYLPPKSRVFIDFLLQRFGSIPYWERLRS